MTFNEWLTETMARRLVVRVAMDPRPRKSDYSALLIGTGLYDSERRIGGYARIEVKSSRVVVAEVVPGLFGDWELPLPGSEGLFADWCRVQTEHLFKWKKVRGLQTFPGYLPLSHTYVIEHLASIKGILMTLDAEREQVLGRQALVRSMIDQLAEVSNEAHRLAYDGI